MKIETGSYVRSCNGIQKVLKVYDNTADNITRYETDISTKHYLLEDDRAISKASFNIIDLIQEGDYVNGKKVLLNDEDYQEFRVDGFNWGNNVVKYENIKSVVTHEQFESMKYEIED